MTYNDIFQDFPGPGIFEKSRTFQLRETLILTLRTLMMLAEL